jgi:chemotaxis protein histidine kinase CheA
MRIGDILQELGRISPEQVKEALELQRTGDPRRLGDILVSLGKLDAQDLQDARELQRRHASRVLSIGSVELLRLQYLAERIRQSWEALRAGMTTVEKLDDTMQESLEQILTGLDSIHMRPIKVLWGRAALHTHRLAASNGIQVVVEIQGDEDLLLDDEPFDKLQDAVLQLCTNAVAHAFEEPSERVAAGKPPTGRLRLSARRVESDVALIEIEDDGRGIALDTVARRAEHMTPPPEGEPSLDWIFLPGFSTNSTANSLSGRGVGMDMIRDNLAELSGTIGLTSCVGVGTQFSIRFPI